MYTEKDLVIPAILSMRTLVDANGFVSTFDLREELLNTLELDDYDMETLPSGQTMRVEQLIRNLKSHHSLLEMGLVDEVPRGFILLGYSNMTVDALEIIVETYAKTPNAFSNKSLTKSNKLSNEKARERVMAAFKKDKIELIIAGKFAVTAAMKTLESFDNDADRIIGITNMVNQIIEEKPHFIKPVIKK